MTPLTPFQSQVLQTTKQLVAQFGYTWLPASYVMAHVRIESGWNPTIKAFDYASTGSVGLMQVTAATTQQMIQINSLAASFADQADATNSLTVGILYIGWVRKYLMGAWGFHNTILYHPICEAYNEGVGNVLKGNKDEAYYLKWAYAQQGYAFVDGAL